MRNPWGNDHEWNGDFSDKWDGWSDYPQLKKALKIGGGAADGLFWMCWDDFKENWSTVSVAAKAMDTLRGTNSTKAGVLAKRYERMGCNPNPNCNPSRFGLGTWGPQMCGGGGTENCNIM